MLFHFKHSRVSMSMRTIFGKQIILKATVTVFFSSLHRETTFSSMTWLQLYNFWPFFAVFIFWIFHFWRWQSMKLYPIFLCLADFRVVSGKYRVNFSQNYSKRTHINTFKHRASVVHLLKCNAPNSIIKRVFPLFYLDMIFQIQTREWIDSHCSAKPV